MRVSVVTTTSATSAARHVSYLVNGAVVDATPTRSGTGFYTETEKTIGLVGVRIDDHIDVQVDGIEIKSPFQLNERGQ